MASTSMTGTGYCRPPVSTRFAPGQSGNPGGRPPGSRNKNKDVPPHEVVLGRMVTIHQNGVARQVTAAHAFMLHLTKKGQEGDAHAAVLAAEALGKMRQDVHQIASTQPVQFAFHIVSPGAVYTELQALKMVQRLDSYRPTARLKINPWLVTQALERLGDRQLTVEEQAEVYQATRTPRKVAWPAWWTEFGKG